MYSDTPSVFTSGHVGIHGIYALLILHYELPNSVTFPLRFLILSRGALFVRLPCLPSQNRCIRTHRQFSYLDTWEYMESMHYWFFMMNFTFWTNSVAPLREPQIAQFLDSVTLQMVTIRSSDTIHQCTQRNIPEHLSSTWLGEPQPSPKSWTTWHSRWRHYVLPKRHKALSVDIALYHKILVSSSAMLCTQSRKRTWTTWLSRGRNLVLPKRREPLWFDKTLHSSRVTLLCDPLKTTVTDVQRKWLTAQAKCVVLCEQQDTATVFWYVTPCNLVRR